MARPKKVVEVSVEEVDAGVTIVEVSQKEDKSFAVSMVRSNDYSEPRTAQVHPDEVEEWMKFGWVKS